MCFSAQLVSRADQHQGLSATSSPIPLTPRKEVGASCLHGFLLAYDLSLFKVKCVIRHDSALNDKNREIHITTLPKVFILMYFFDMTRAHILH